MLLRYVPASQSWPINWETGQPDYGNVAFAGPGWYQYNAGEYGGPGTWAPLYFTLTYSWDGAPIRQSTGQELPAPGAPFGSSIDFGTISPTTGYASYLYLTNADVAGYLNQKFGGALANHLNALHKGVIESQLAAARSSPGGAEVSLSPIGGEYPYAVVTGTAIGWMYDGTLPSGHALIASPDALGAALNAIGAGADPIAAKYVEWLRRAQEQANTMDAQQQKAATVRFWMDTLKYVGLAVGAVGLFAGTSLWSAISQQISGGVSSTTTVASLTEIAPMDEFYDLGFTDWGTEVVDPGLDWGVDWGTEVVDPGLDWGADWGTDLSADWGTTEIGLDPWSEVMQVDTGNIGLDVPEYTAADVAQETGSSVWDVSQLQWEFPDVSLTDVFRYAKQGLDLYRAFQQATAEPVAPRVPTVAPRTYTPRTTTPTTRTVTDPTTGRAVTQRYNPATGQWEAVTEWIPGVPNWALIAGGGAIALLALGGTRRSR
jgi:hypothetical protein